MKQEKRGGKRTNAGRPPQYIEETVPISLRVPKSKEIEIRNKIAKICKPLISVCKRENPAKYNY